MYEVRNGKVCFILNDFDLATVVTDEGEPSAVASSKHRTGTLPFMAYELLKDMTRSNKNGSGPRVMHRLRHELESLLYVTVWSTVATPDAEGKKTEFVDYLRTWEMGTVKSVEKLKWSLCSDPDEVNDIPLPLAVEPLREVFIRWFAILRRAYTKWNEIRYPEESQVSISLQEDFDVETLDGMITRDTVYKAVTEGLVAAGLAECIRTKASDGAILNAENDSREAKANGNKSSGNKANSAIPVNTSNRFPTRATKYVQPKPKAPKAPDPQKSRADKSSQRIPSNTANRGSVNASNTSTTKNVDVAKKTVARRIPKAPKSTTTATRTMTTRSMMKTLTSTAKT